MRGDSATWGRGAVVLGLLSFALVLGACGAGDDSNSPEPRAQAASQVLPAGDEGVAGDQGQSAPDESRAADQKSSPNSKQQGGAAGSTQSADAQQGNESGTGGTGSAKNGGGAAHEPRKIKPPHKGKSGGAVKPGGPTLPVPGQTDGDTYETARQTCGNQELLDMVPPEYRDAEYLARLYADFYSPDNKQPAYEGCLAGLHSLGL